MRWAIGFTGFGSSTRSASPNDTTRVVIVIIVVVIGEAELRAHDGQIIAYSPRGRPGTAEVNEAVKPQSQNARVLADLAKL